MSVAQLADAEVRKMLERTPFASLSTINADGSPHVTYIAFIWDGQHFTNTCQNYRVNYRNVQRDPRVALMIVDAANPMRNISIKCTAETLPPPAGNDVLVHVHAKLDRLKVGEHQGEPIVPLATRGALRLTPVSAFTYGF